jgi:hypothetical protein
VGEYVGETSRTAWERQKEHKEGLRRKDEKGALWKHCENEHEGETQAFSMEVLRKFKGSLARQVSEAVEIMSSKADCLMNSKGEYGGVRLPRIVIEMGDKVREDEWPGGRENEDERRGMMRRKIVVGGKRGENEGGEGREMKRMRRGSVWEGGRSNQNDEKADGVGLGGGVEDEGENGSDGGGNGEEDDGAEPHQDDENEERVSEEWGESASDEKVEGDEQEEVSMMMCRERWGQEDEEREEEKVKQEEMRLEKEMEDTKRLKADRQHLFPVHI